MGSTPFSPDGGCVKAFLTELKARKVIQVAIVYLVAGWVIMQVADVMFPALGLPEWGIKLVAALLDYRGLRPGELERIRKMLAEAKGSRVKKG